MTQDEATVYIDAADGDELGAALMLAYDNAKGGTPDGVEIHHAYFQLRHAFGKLAPPWETVRVELRDRGWINEPRINKGQP